MITKTILIFLVSSTLVKSQSLETKLEKYKDDWNISVHEDAGLDIYQFLDKYNYLVETHWVQTEDGYVLRMQRVFPRYQQIPKVVNKPPVLLMHGLLSSGMDFVNMGPNKSIGLVLADSGFDVWLGNNRGSTWSRQHVTLSPDIHKNFWNYSFETCGYYDLPAKIDYILEKTGRSKVFYIGHSQGTSQFFAMSALRPEYNDKIALMSALAPVAYMTHLSSPLPRLLAQNMDILQSVAELLNWYEVLGYSKLTTLAGSLVCSKFEDLCATFLFILCGFDPPQLDKSFIPVITSNDPAGISLKMLLHYGQEIRSGEFRRFDYGSLLNQKYYNSYDPPPFDISAMTAPIALYYSENDFMAAVQDVEKFAAQLPNLKQSVKVNQPLFNHLDFIFAKDVNTIINLGVIDYMKKFVDDTIPTPSPDPGPDNSASQSFIGNAIFVSLFLPFLQHIFIKYVY